MIKWFIPLYILLACRAFYLYKHQTPDALVGKPTKTNTKLWESGRVVYQQRCTTCHNSNPDLAGSVGPSLRGVSKELLVDRLTNGKGAMPIQKDMLRFVLALREFLK